MVHSNRKERYMVADVKIEIPRRNSEGRENNLIYLDLEFFYRLQGTTSHLCKYGHCAWTIIMNYYGLE